MSNRRDEIVAALRAVRVRSPKLARTIAELIIEREAERTITTRGWSGVIELAQLCRVRGEPPTMDEARAAYRGVPSLVMYGSRRLYGDDLRDRDNKIALNLMVLDGLGLATTSHKDDRSMKSSRTALPDGERPPSLALAMHEATGIGESVIATVWTRRGPR